MISILKRIWRDKRGNALMIAAACLPMIVGAAGLASDTIQWTLWKRQLQRAADSAAIAGVYNRERANGATTTTSAAVSHDLTINEHTWMSLVSGYPVVTYPADSGVMTDQVKVVLQVQQSLPFSSMFMSAAPVITATSTAASLPAGGDACIEALDTASATGVTFSGNSAVEMPTCDIFSNTAGTNSAVGKGSSSVIANSVGGVGGIQQSNNFTVSSYRPYSPALADPFASVTPDPTQMHCAVNTQSTTKKGVTTTTYTPLSLTDGMDITTLKDQYGNPANCFSSLSVGSNQTLTIPDSYTGPIYLDANFGSGGGGATFQGNFSCSACSIVMTSSSTATSPTIGTIKTNAGANVNITAPTSGTYKGIAIMQDRRAASCTGNCNSINGNSASVITGAIYFPSQEIYYNGTGSTNATCTMFVAKRITFSGNSGTSNKFKSLTDCASAGLPGASTVRMVRLVA